MQTKDVLISVGIVVGFIIFISILRFVKRNRILHLIQTQNFVVLEKELDSIMTRMLIPPYNRENIRLNTYLMKQDKHKIDEQFERLLPVVKKPLQNQEFLTKMFNHYLFEKDKKRCRKLLDQIQTTIKQESILHESKMLYQIFFEKSYDYIDELIQRMDSMDDEQKAMCAYYISLQYENKNDSSNAQKYRELSKSLF